MPADTAFMDKLTALCKRRGFIFQSSEIYGGIGGFWDYGPLGVELKRNIKDTWWRDMVTNPPAGPDGKEIEMVGVDCSIIMNPKVWEASGHVGGFSDPMMDCKKCKARLRADQGFLMLLKRSEADEPFATCSVEAGGPDEAVAVVEAKAKKLSKKHGGGDYVAVAIDFLSAAQNDLAALQCPRCDTTGSMTEPREFNLMFMTYVGALVNEDSKAYLRPETAQGIFANYQNVLDTSRVKLPFGIAQVGKSFRNEINPRNYTFRSREFEQMEIEFFCHDDKSMEWYEFWRNTRFNWYVNLGLQSSKLQLRDQDADELAHYSKACADIEYLFPFSEDFQELEGVAHRGCYDLSQHQKHSGRDLTYFDDDAWERDKEQHPKDQHKEIKNKAPYRFLPTVIEPSAGADRATLAFLCEAYTEDEAPDDKGNMQTRTLMKFHPKLAPIKAAIFPLVKKEGMPEVADKIYKDCKQHFNAFYDDKGAVGRRYRRQDEVGTPYCVTVDGQTLEDGTVTVRDRDTLAQDRVSKDQVVTWLQEKLRA
jgi:glycyl-tRNA synthetase